MSQKKVLLLGSYGQSNLGDDLLMWNYLEFLKDAGATEVYVNANTTEHLPQVIKKAYPNLHVVPTYKTSVSDYIKLIKKVDYIIYGGGTLYKELYTSTGRSPYGVILRLAGFNLLARILGTKIYHLHIGIGSLKTWRGRFITRLAINAATKTLFRDRESFKFAREILHIAPEKIEQSVDGLFINHIWQTLWHTYPLGVDRKKYKRVIGINVLSDIPDWINREQYLHDIRAFVATLLKRGDFVVFIPFQSAFNPNNDLTFMKSTFKDVLKKYKNYKILNTVPIDQVHSLLTQCDILVGMRFHSLLLAAASSVPFIALAYDTKCWRFIEETHYPYALRLEDFTHDKLLGIYDSLVDERTAAGNQLAATAKRMYIDAEEGLRTLNL